MTTLGVAFDDPEDPAEVTLFATGPESGPTKWITAELDDTLSLDRMR